MRDRAVRSSAANAPHKRPAAGSVASPCRSILIYKPRPEGAPIHYCPAHSSRRGPVTSGRPLPRRFLPFHHQIRTVRRATSGARGPAGRSRSAGGAAPAFLFLSCFWLPLPRFRCPGPTQVLTRQLATCFCATETAARGHNGTESGNGAAAEMPRALRRRLHFATPRATPLRSRLFRRPWLVAQRRAGE